MSDFVPPLYSKLSKKIDDFFKKKFGDKKEFTMKTLADSGRLTFESGMSFNDKSGSYGGNMVARHSQKEFGNTEFTLNTSGKVKGSLELNQIQPGMVLKITGEEAPSGELAVDYSKECYSLSAKVKATTATTEINASGVIGFDGLSIGGDVKYDTTSQLVTDFNAGAQYTQPKDFTFTLKTENSADKVVASYLHHVNSDVDVGARFSYCIDGGKRGLELGSAWKKDRNTTIKTKINSDGIVETALEQKLFAPNLTYTLSAKYAVTSKDPTPQSFGLGFVFGA